MKIEEITDRLDRLRCDMSATWTALAAMQTVLTPEQRQQVLEAMAKASAQKQAMYDAPLPTPEAQAVLSRYREMMQASEGRVYEMLQGGSKQFQTR